MTSSADAKTKQTNVRFVAFGSSLCRRLVRVFLMPTGRFLRLQGVSYTYRMLLELYKPFLEPTRPTSLNSVQTKLIMALNLINVTVSSTQRTREPPIRGFD